MQRLHIDNLNDRSECADLANREANLKRRSHNDFLNERPERMNLEHCVCIPDYFKKALYPSTHSGTGTLTPQSKSQFVHRREFPTETRPQQIIQVRVLLHENSESFRRKPAHAKTRKPACKFLEPT